MNDEEEETKKEKGSRENADYYLEDCFHSFKFLKPALGPVAQN